MQQFWFLFFHHFHHQQLNLFLLFLLKAYFDSQLIIIKKREIIEEKCYFICGLRGILFYILMFPTVLPLKSECSHCRGPGPGGGLMKITRDVHAKQLSRMQGQSSVVMRGLINTIAAACSVCLINLSMLNVIVIRIIDKWDARTCWSRWWLLSAQVQAVQEPSFHHFMKNNIYQIPFWILLAASLLRWFLLSILAKPQHTINVTSRHFYNKMFE